MPNEWQRLPEPAKATACAQRKPRRKTSHSVRIAESCGGNTPGNARKRWHRDSHSAYATFTLSAWGCRLTGWGSLGCLSRTCGRNRAALTRSCAFGTATRG